MSISEERRDAVRQWLGPDKLRVLTDVFTSGKAMRPGVPAARYRADHHEWMGLLDRLESEQLFLQRSRPSQADYVVRVYALPLIPDSHARELVECMDVIFTQLKVLYREHLSASVPLATLLAALCYEPGSGQRTLAIEALFYMTDSHIWGGYGNEFPFDENSALSISEGVLRKDSFSTVLDEFFDWHIFNPRRTVHAFALEPTATALNSPLLSRAETDDAGMPEWYGQLPETQRALIIEIEAAVAGKLSGLPIMGLRTLLETIMFEHVGDKRSFKATLAAFVEGQFVTGQHAKLLESILDAGHASVHRAYFPNEADLQTCIKSIRHLMEGLYVLKPKVDALAANTPKRQPD